MARPRQYGSDAEKQAAYRERRESATTTVDKEALGRLHARLATLQTVVSRAADKGDTLAVFCRAASTDTMLDKLIALFQERNEEPNQDRSGRSEAPTKTTRKQTG